MNKIAVKITISLNKIVKIEIWDRSYVYIENISTCNKNGIYEIF